MREVVFRGKRVDNGEWIYGDLATQYLYPRVFIVVKVKEMETEWHEVDPKTVGQKTQFIYEDLEHIYEGDIVLCEQKGSEPFISEVLWEDDCFMVYQPLGENKYGCGHPLVTFDMTRVWSSEPRITKLGNVHDNPELLEVNNNEEGC